MPDIDIDFADREQILKHIQYVNASRLQNNELVPHNTGIYVQSIPSNPILNLSNIDYKTAEDEGYFKIDFLNVNIYKDVKNEEHLVKLMENEPLWDLLEQDEFTNLLFHINGHGDILRTMKPKTLEQLAAVLAMIRPAKRYLIGKTWETVMMEVWKKPESDDYYFKKAHAIAYAQAIIVQMNLICESIAYEHYYRFGLLTN
jgi:DNA polymerase III alpha subunit